MASSSRRKIPPNGSSSLSSSSPSLPQLHLHDGAISNGTTTALKCRGEFCRVAPSALRGLYAASIDSSEDPSDDHDAAGDADATPRRSRRTVLADDGRRFKIGNNNLLLAKAEMAFLVGSSGDEDDVALQWQEADSVHRTELGRSNPSAFYKQVSVCRNCHRIYADLASFRGTGFRWDHKLKHAWGTTPQDYGKDPAKKATTKKKKSRFADAAVATETVGSPEDDALSLEYDRMFLAELAKHSDVDATSSSRQPSEASARSEAEGNAPARAFQAALPTLGKNISIGSGVSKKKHTHVVGVAGQNELATGNQQSTDVTNRREEKLGGEGTVFLEKVNAQLGEDLAREQSAVKRLEAQRQLLEQRLAQSQTLIQEKEDEFRKKLLEAELDSMGKKMHGASSASTTASATAADVGELIEAIDALNRQLHQSNSETEKVRRDLVQHHQQDVKRLHEKYQIEMEALRLSEYTAKEQAETAHMQMTQCQNEAQVSASQAKNARAALDDLTKNRLSQLESKNQRLERQLSELKAKTTANPIPSPSNSPSPDIAAIEKHLNNKIEYLKAQLASEMKCKEELGSHLAGITSSMEALKKEKRAALTEQEEVHKGHLERCESNFTQEKDTLCTQLASAQGKIAMLQANVTDLVQEVTMWKSRDTNTKLALEKMAEESVRLNRQIVDLESQVEALQDERKRDGSMGVKNANEETQRMQMEALLRRLDNERIYLKNQVDNEAESKKQAQHQVHGLQQELLELQSTSEELTKMAEHKISTLDAERAHFERLLREEKAALEESKLMLTRQLKEMQLKFVQSREQSLLDKDELEKARIELSESRSHLIAAREETMKEKEYGKSANDRMSRAMATIKGSLKAMEEEKNLRISRLEDENAMYLQKLARSQGELLVLETKWSEDKQTFRRQQALARIACVLNHNLEMRHHAVKSVALWRIRVVSAVGIARAELRSDHQIEMTEREHELRREFMDKCDELTQTLHSERVEALKQAGVVRDREKEELQQYYEQERSQLEEDLQHIHSRQMHELEEQYKHTIKAVDEQSAAVVGALQRQCEDLQRERDEARAVLDETRARFEQLSSTTEANQQNFLDKWLEKEQMWRQEKESLLSAHKVELEEVQNQLQSQTCELKETHETAMAREREAADERHQEEIVSVRKDLDRRYQEKVNAINQQHEQEIQDLHARHESRLEEEGQRLVESGQKELDQERATHEKTLRAALERVESKTQGHLESLQKDMNDRKANAILQCTAKWQKAMEDLQARLEVENKVAYESGVQDRENEWQQAALQIKHKQKDELANVQNEAVRAIQAAEERHKMLLQAQLTALYKEFDEKKQHELEIMRNEIIAAEKHNSQLELATALKNQEDMLASRFADETNNIREELADDHSANMKRLVETHTLMTQELMQTHEREQQDLIEQLERAHTHMLDQLRADKDSELETRLEDQEREFSRQLEAARFEMQEVFGAEVAAKLKEQEERLLNEQEDAINQVQEDSEKLIEQVEVAMTELKKQKEALENELSRLRSALEEAEDAHFDVAENLKKQQKSMVFQVMALIMHAKKTLEDGTHQHAQQMMKLQSKHDNLDNQLQRDKKQWDCDVAQIRETWSQLQSRHSEMLQTLTSYKRDELVAHRSASAVLSNEVGIVSKQMEEVHDMKVVLEKEIEQLQSEVHGVEASLRQLMLQSSSSPSSTGDGSLNMATVAKKRRLNEEFEALLEQVERKKAEVHNMDKTLASLRQRREEKEAQLKTMERKLVEILVGQQKQLHAQLSATREVALPPALAVVTAR